MLNLYKLKNDIKVIENALGIELIEDPEYMVNKEWETVTLETINSYVEEGSLFDTKGSVDEELDGEFYLVEDELAKTNLNLCLNEDEKATLELLIPLNVILIDYSMPLI